MESNVSFEGMPRNYMMCIHASCPRSAACLRYQAYENLSEPVVGLKMLNPKLDALQAEDCPYFRSMERVRYAKGFIGILNTLPVGVWKSVTAHLQCMFNGRNYYRLRKGERLLAPKEQEAIISLLRRDGVQEIPEFDDYVEEFKW